ncbi:MAG: ParB/RepB/Spo0J family partition protein [Rhodothermia bacterium]|nr:ParB/RepB/Spo0J family partition protein [Rhodothermia bacterium]
MATKKAALGRGLDALISTPAEVDSDESNAGLQESKMYDFEDRLRLVGRVAEIEIDKIDANPYQPRAAFDEAGIDELAASIKQLGIIQPITVRAVGSGKFELISGERRLRASRIAGLQRIPAYVREADSESMLEMAIVENIQREELNPIEIALGYQRLIEELDLTQEQVAEKVGKSRVAVTNMLRLLKLPPFIQALLKTGSLSVGHARALINVDDESIQQKVVEDTVREGLSVREVERRVRSLSEPKPKPKKKVSSSGADETVDPHLKALVDRIRTKFSTQVQIRTSDMGAGKIELSFYSQDDLQRLVDLLME